MNPLEAREYYRHRIEQFLSSEAIKAVNLLPEALQKQIVFTITEEEKSRSAFALDQRCSENESQWTIKIKQQKTVKKFFGLFEAEWPWTRITLSYSFWETTHALTDFGFLVLRDKQIQVPKTDPDYVVYADIFQKSNDLLKEKHLLKITDPIDTL